MNNIIVRELLRHKLSFSVAFILLTQLLLESTLVSDPATRYTGLLLGNLHFGILLGLTGFLFFCLYQTEVSIKRHFLRYVVALFFVLALTGVFFFWTSKISDPYIHFQLLALFAALVLAGKPADLPSDDKIWSWQNSFVKSVAEAIIVAGVFLVFCQLAFELVEFVFETESPQWLRQELVPKAAFSVLPCAVFLIRMPTHRELHSKFVRMLVAFFLVPLWLFYVALLNIYALKILVQWTLPRGLVSAPVIFAFAAYVLVWWGLKHLDDRDPARWPSDRLLQLTKWLHLPLLSLLYIAISRRIWDHGLTQPRYFIVLLALLCSAIWALDYMKRLNGRSFTFAFLAACLLSLIPV